MASVEKNNTVDGVSYEVQARETRLCNVCLYLKDFAEFNKADIGCKRCRNDRCKEVRRVRAKDLFVHSERGKYITGLQAELLGALIKGRISDLSATTIMSFCGVDKVRVKRWFHKRSFIAAVDDVAKRYDLSVEMYFCDKLRMFPLGLTAGPVTESSIVDSEPVQAVGEGLAGAAVTTPEARLDSIASFIALINCELSFGAGTDPKKPLACQLSDAGGHVLATTCGATPTVAMENMASRLLSEDLDFVSANVLKLVLGEQGFRNQIGA